VVQETFLAAQKNIGKLMRSDNPGGWLTNTLKYKIQHEKRARARFIVLIERIAKDPSSYAFSDNGYGEDILHFLEKSEYEVLRLLYIDGYSPKEIAGILKISYDACRKRIQAAKRKLAQERQ
jgi:RNA polymerase sigma-70 factor (ECF subfamily)